MSSIDCAGTSCVEIEANHPDASPVPAARVRDIVQLFAAEGEMPRIRSPFETEN